MVTFFSLNSTQRNSFRRLTAADEYEAMMGKMATELAQLFEQAVNQKIVSINTMSKAKANAAENLKDVATFQELVERGHDPVHAIYTHTLNLISLFSEQATTLPPLHPIHDFISKWLDIYLPALPPMSPITKSYFTCWTSFDAAFGASRETVGTCFLYLIDRLRLDPIHAEAAKHLNQSRMGLYVVLQGKQEEALLQELITGKVFNTRFYSGYESTPGDLLFVRLVPPVADSADYFVALTTPYLFVEQSPADWNRYFARHGIRPTTAGVEARLHKHLKYGPNRTYWSEFVFYGYMNYAPGVIYMTGFPDQVETQPAHRSYRRR